jgi:hypothetical protein
MPVTFDLELVKLVKLFLYWFVCLWFIIMANLFFPSALRFYATLLCDTLFFFVVFCGVLDRRMCWCHVRHVSTEVWDQSATTQSLNQTYRVCNNSGEDPSCSDSDGLLKWNIKDHLWYMGVEKVACN